MASPTYPGDDIIPNAEMVYNQYRTMRATADEIFPWIVQLGKRRGGWYLPTRFERLLPVSWRACRSIDPAFQQLAVGDRVPDYGSKSDYFDVVSIDPPRALVYESERYGTRFSWAIVLHECEEPSSNDGPMTVVHLRFRGGMSSKGIKRKLIVRGGGILDYLTTAPMLAGLAERVERR